MAIQDKRKKLENTWAMRPPGWFLATGGTQKIFRTESAALLRGESARAHRMKAAEFFICFLPLATMHLPGYNGSGAGESVTIPPRCTGCQKRAP